MALEIFSVKLSELEDQISRLSSRIRLIETADQKQLDREIQNLNRECTETEMTLQKKLQMSRAEIVRILSDSYVKTEGILRETEEKLQDREAVLRDQDAAADEQVLLAEYALDFAVQAANRAVLLSMRASNAQQSSAKTAI
jgi:hypothetical protein